MRDELGYRMKAYEYVTRTKLIRRLPVLVRIDGKSFHTFTKGFKKPFDSIITEAMWETSKELCKSIQGCKIAYTQSDEISLLLIDYEKLDTNAWFDNNVQKMASVSASIATLAFNKSFEQIVKKYIYCLENYNSTEDEEYLFEKYGIRTYLNEEDAVSIPEWAEQLKEIYEKRINTALFDSRAWNLPKEEVNNYFVWRQQDASKNSISMVGQANFSHEKLKNKSGNMVQEMLFQEKGINWNNLPTYQKRGACIVKKQYTLDNEKQTIRNKWEVDKDTPIFTKDKSYIEQYVYPEVK